MQALTVTITETVSSQTANNKKEEEEGAQQQQQQQGTAGMTEKRKLQELRTVVPECCVGQRNKNKLAD